MMSINDNLFLGLFLGLIIPPIVVYLLAISVNQELFDYSSTYFENICLMGIGINAGVMWLVLNKLKKDKIGRGILIVNFAYVIAFITYFYI